MPTFSELGLSKPLLAALDDVGYVTPSPIQAKAIKPLLSGNDVIGQAQTGTGKTAAFGLPLIQYVDPDLSEVQALVLTPTRELCIQVTQALRAYSTHKGLKVVAVFGGTSVREQQASLSGAQIVVGTCGRVRDLISRHTLMLHTCRFVVLDEADEMLDLGFIDDVERILNLTPSGRQTALFSATMPPEIRRLADRYLYNPTLVKVQAKTLTVDTVEQFALEVDRGDKSKALLRVIQAEKPTQAIVFVRTKIRCEQIYRNLNNNRQRVKALHGDMGQGSRDGVMIAFKSGRVPLLVATDVAARGLDISGVTHVINLDIPASPEVYVHRIGRTGRVGRAGRAITLFEPPQRRELEAIERHTKTTISPWVVGAHVAPAHTEIAPKRHLKPGDTTTDKPLKYTRLLADVGKATGLTVSDLVRTITHVTKLSGESIRNVEMLERFTFLDVPADQAKAVVESVNQAKLNGQKMKLEVLSG